MHNMHISEEVAGILEASFRLAGTAHFEYITPELLLYVTCQNPSFAKAFENCGGSLAELDRSLKTYLEEYMQPGAGKHAKPQMSQGTAGLLDAAWESVQNSGGQVKKPGCLAGYFRGQFPGHYAEAADLYLGREP